MIDETTTCRGCNGALESGRTWHPECLTRYRRSTNYRKVALERDGYACAKCLRVVNDLILADRMSGKLRLLPWRTRTVDVDHITPLGLGGSNDPSNYQVLCTRHHKRKTRVDVARIKGYRPSLSQGVLAGWLVLALAVLGAGWWGWRRVQTSGLADVDPKTVGAVVAAVLVVGGALYLLRAWQMRVVQRLYESLAKETEDSYAAKRRIKVHRWGRVEGALRPTDFTLYYPHTYEDSEPDRQTKLENRAVAKLGWDSHIARWKTSKDCVRLTSPDPFVVNPPHVWEGPPASIWDPINVGISAEGKPVTVSLVERNLLIGGEPGGGKSNALSVILAACAADPNVTLYLADGKGTEFGQWEPCAARSVVETEDFQELLEDLLDTIKARYTLMRLEHKRKVERDDGLGLIVLVVDELAEFLSGSKANKEIIFEPLRRIVSLGRAAGVVVVAATQRPSFEIVPTDLRDLFGFRWALRCTTPSSSDMTLGQGWASQGYSASKIGPKARGAGYLLAEEGTPALMRTSYIDDAALTRWAAHAREVRELVTSAGSASEESAT